MPLRVAVLVKQVPKVEEMALGPDGRLRRDGVELELNAYCRRAVSKGVELARDSGGSCTVITLGPPAAEDALREAVAWGADAGVLVTDVAFAGSDTLATARALVAALQRTGPWDLVLVGRNSVDADTGQVGPAVAELLGLPFLGGVKVLDLDGATVRARCEYDDGWVLAETALPAVLSCAERLCEPCKVKPDKRAAVPAERIERIDAAALGPGPWGQAGSPTHVGEVRVFSSTRRRQVLDGPVAEQVHRAVALLREAGALPGGDGPAAHSPAAHSPAADGSAAHSQAADAAADLRPEAVHAAVPDGWTRGAAAVAVLIEPARPRVADELLGAAARLAEQLGGTVVAVLTQPGDAVELARRGADEIVVLDGVAVEEDVARALAGWCEQRTPWAVLAPGTMWGREVAGRVAARLGAGLVGDAVDLTVADGRLVGWKPAFGGAIVAAITATSPVQMATVRPGVLGLPAPRAAREAPTTRVAGDAAGRVRVLDGGREDEIDELVAAAYVVGVGQGVAPDAYHRLDPLRRVLGAELAATRKVTDKGWLPHARQVGITGRSIAPKLYVALGMSGKFNHLVGVRRAGCVLAVNRDPDAPVFAAADVGIVGDWDEVVPLLAAAIEADTADAPAPASA